MKHATLLIVLLCATPAVAAQQREESTTRCARHAPAKTVPGYYDANKRWVPPQYIRGECVEWKTTTTRQSPPPRPKPDQHRR